MMGQEKLYRRSNSEKVMKNDLGQPNVESGLNLSNSALNLAMGLGNKSNPDLGAIMQKKMQARFGSAAFSPQMGERNEPFSEPTQMEGGFDNIRETLENKSGVSLADVKVHYNSPEPGKIGAHAFAKGTDVFMGSGQEKYLGHELTHVVQQKQGLVHPDAVTESGAPVNTSSALESAADHMQVSSAPAISSGPVAYGGVVQGVFKSGRTGKILKKKDVLALAKMMQGSLESHAEEAGIDIKLNEDHHSKRNQKAAKKRTEVDSAYVRGYMRDSKTVTSRYLNMMNSKEEYVIEDILGGEIGRSIRLSKEENSKMYRRPYSSDFQYGTLRRTGAVEGMEEGDFVNERNTREAYQRTEDAYHIAEQALPGVENIAEYDPSKQKGEELLVPRMGNSGTLDPNEPENTPKTIAKAKKGFENAAEVARKGAVALRKTKGDIGFSDLFGIFTNLNKAARPNDKNGGKLRGRYIQAGRLFGVDSGKVGEQAYRTFSLIADRMNAIKKLPDRDLQKTQAIQLASFAQQMTISEHMFSDGNGRSCRLLADTILQTFGLPPHSPQEEQMHISKTMGEQMDFDVGANMMLNAVQRSDAKIKENQARQASQPKKKGFLASIGSWFKGLFSKKKK